MDMKKILQALDKTSTRQVDGTNDMRRFVSVVTESNKSIDECSGYIPKNAEEAKDPRYSTALTVDVQPGAIEKNLKALSLAEGRKTFSDYLNEAAKKCNHTVEGKECPVHGLEECSMYEEDLDEVAGAKKCWPGHRKVGTQPGTGKNAGKRVNDCEKIEEDDEVDESGLQYHTGVKKHGKEYMKKAAAAGREGASQKELGALKDKYSKAYKEDSVEEAAKKGLYYYVNKRKAAGTSRDADSPKAPTAQAWKDAAKTAKK